MRARDPDHPLAATLMPLFEKDDRVLVSRVPAVYSRLRTLRGPARLREALSEVFTDFLAQRLPQTTLNELAMLMNLTPRHKTRIYMDAKAEGKIEGKIEGALGLALRAAEARFGPLKSATSKAVRGLDYLDLEQLIEALFVMKQPADLARWLNDHKD